MTDTTVQDRAAQLDRYVALDAVETFIRRTADFAGIDALAVLSLDDDIALADSVDLFSSLWPDEVEEGEPQHGPLNPESVEAMLADARSEALTARILTLLATDDGREWLLDEAIKLTGAAESRTAKATAKLATAATVSAHVS